VGVSSSHFTQSRVATEKVLKGKNAKKWEITMEEKYNFLVVNSIWSLMPFPKGRKPISCKWVFKIKHGVDGEIKCYKARIMAKGFTQTFGVNYDETFAPDAKFESIRCILALTIIEDMEIHQMDIKITFFNGDLKEEIYCRNPNLAKCGGEAQHLEKLGIWSPPGLPNVQSSTAGLKTPRIGVFLVSLERS
jgi:hypothetical protein